jgi:transcriptional regulator with XRE-family HTH domain
MYFMITVERIEKLCTKNKITVAELERRIGIGNGVIRRWKERTPASDKLKDIAHYFDCTVDYLLGITNKPDRMAPTELKEYGVEWISVVKSARAAGLSPAQMNELIETVKKLK